MRDSSYNNIESADQSDDEDDEPSDTTYDKNFKLHLSSHEELAYEKKYIDCLKK